MSLLRSDVDMNRVHRWVGLLNRLVLKQHLLQHRHIQRSFSLVKFGCLAFLRIRFAVLELNWGLLGFSILI